MPHERITCFDELKRIRLRRGFSQEDLSQASKVSEFTISEIELGKRANPRPSTLRKLAGALDVEVADLYGEPFVSPKEKAPLSLDWALAAPLEEFNEAISSATLHEVWSLIGQLNRAAKHMEDEDAKHGAVRRAMDGISEWMDRVGPLEEVRRKAPQRGGGEQRPASGGISGEESQAG